MIRSLIFDFGKVLVDYDFYRFIESFIPDLEKKDRFISCILTDSWFKTLDKEDRPFEETIKEMQELYPEFTKEIQIFADEFPSIVDREVPGMRELLAKLKAEGYKLYGLTNWCDRVHVTMAQYGIFKLLDGQVISSEVHEIKPFPQIYRILFEKFGLKPEECVFTDDKQENIDGSIAVGMPAILFRNAEQYEIELRKIIEKSI